MARLSGGGGEGGFSLIELIVVVLIMGMVLMGLAAIHGSSFRQGLNLFGESRIKTMGELAMTALRTQASRATFVAAPLNGAGSRSFSGYINVAADGSGGWINPVANPPPPGGEPRWFHFCVSPDAADVGTCRAAGTQNPRPCLFFYDGPLAGGAAPPRGWGVPAVLDANCGQGVPGANLQLLATGIQPIPQGGGAAPYFSRGVAGGVSRQQVRMRMRIRQPPGDPTRPSSLREFILPVDTVVSLQMSLPGT